MYLCFCLLLAVEGWVLFVTGIHEEATEDDFLDLFSEFGSVKDIRLPLDHRTGFLKGYAFVEYHTLQEAQNALAALDGKTFLDYILGVSFAFTTNKPQM